MGSCWDANSGKEGAKRLMLPVKFQPQPLEQRYRHVQINKFFLLFLRWKNLMVVEVIVMGIGFQIHNQFYFHPHFSWHPTEGELQNFSCILSGGNYSVVYIFWMKGVNISDIIFAYCLYEMEQIFQLHIVCTKWGKYAGQIIAKFK